MSFIIRLSIKAANGSVNDFNVEAESSWTILQLKNHLYRHYPTHPPLPSQKLIYSGKLLKDGQTLATSLPSDVDPVVVHLVAYQRSQSSPAVVSNPQSAPASRQSSLGTVSEETDQPQQEQQPQQEATPQPQPAGQPPPPWLRYRGQTPPTMMGLPPQFYLSPYGAAYAQQMALWYQNYYAATTVPVAPPPLERDEENVEPLNNRQDGVEVEDDVPVNAAGGAAGLGMMAGGEGGGRRNRDMVDVLYMVTMFGFLGLVAYLTGSLGRLLVFASGVLFVLLNQGGWFSIRRRRQAPPVVNDVNPLNRPEQVGAAAAQEPQQAPPDDNTPAAAAPPPEPPQPQDQRQGILATLFVFITSFFTSLIPHQRPELQAN